MQERIPRVIHYCWFGGNPLTELAEKCIESWKKYCPDYEIIEWNESNFDINCCDYVREAYEAKKWAFVSDVARLFVLVNYGGIYMDTDVEVVKPLDDILKYEAVSGFQSDNQIPTGLMACEKGQLLFEEFLHDYDNIHFTLPDGKYDLTTNVTKIKKICLKYGFVHNNSEQTVRGFKLFPSDYFCAKDVETRKITITDNTYTIHHFDGSWKTDTEREAIEFAARYRKYIPIKMAKFMYIAKHDGLETAFKKVKGLLRDKADYYNDKKSES